MPGILKHPAQQSLFFTGKGIIKVILRDPFQMEPGIIRKTQKLVTVVLLQAEK